MLRVYALYNKSLNIALILVLLHALRFSATIWTIVRYWDIYKADFGYICFTTESLELKVGLAVFILAEILYQSLIHTLIAKKTWTLPSTWSKTPTLTSVLTRDGFYVFFAIFVAMMAFVGGSYEKGPAPLFIQPLIIFTLSCAGSRVIIRLQCCGSESSSNSQEQGMLSTVAWDTRTFPSSDA
uniref:Uncharacterized protein n=1 Tax=Moniliophthora roreri TaxID=221103 RepID=A0A0W0GD45_MONRR